LQPATKANRMWATDAHVGIAATITPHELISLTSGRESANAFTNRFVIIYAERHRLIALTNRAMRTWPAANGCCLTC
jgi:hypothetical protein